MINFLKKKTKGVFSLTKAQLFLFINELDLDLDLDKLIDTTLYIVAFQKFDDNLLNIHIYSESDYHKKNKLIKMIKVISIPSGKKVISNEVSINRIEADKENFIRKFSEFFEFSVSENLIVIREKIQDINNSLVLEKNMKRKIKLKKKKQNLENKSSFLISSNVFNLYKNQKLSDWVKDNISFYDIKKNGIEKSIL